MYNEIPIIFKSRKKNNAIKVGRYIAYLPLPTY